MSTMKKKTEQKVIKFIDAQGLLNQGDKVLIALSGGPDSVLALHFFRKFKKRFKIDIAAVHLNHKLRGKDSEKDEKFCKDLCEQLKIEFISTQVAIEELKSKSKKSIEEIARNERYKFFDYASTKLHVDKIITAHNQDDNTETVLLNLIKGTGTKGLAGIPLRRGKIIRPLLCLNKSEILDYLKQSKLKYRKDKSNDENEYQRNIIRNKVIPIIQSEINPSLNETVFRTSNNLRFLSTVISKQAKIYFDKYVDQKEDLVNIKLNLFREVETLFVDEVIKLSLEKFLQNSVTSKDIAKIRSLYEYQVGKEVKFRRTFRAIRERDAVEISKSKSSKIEDRKIKAGQKIQLGSKWLSISTVKNSRFIMSQPGCEFVSINVQHPTFTLRRWKEGDKFKPLGMKNFKKVSDFLTDLKIPASNKKEQLVLTYRNQILWVVGLRIDERYKITSQTKRAIKLCLK